MIEVLTSNTRGRLLSADILDSMYRLRSEAFAERLGWDVTSVRGREMSDTSMMATPENQQPAYSSLPQRIA